MQYAYECNYNINTIHVQYKCHTDMYNINTIHECNTNTIQIQYGTHMSDSIDTIQIQI